MAHVFHSPPSSSLTKYVTHLVAHMSFVNLYDDCVLKLKSHLLEHLINHIEKIEPHETILVLENADCGVLVIMLSNLRSD